MMKKLWILLVIMVFALAGAVLAQDEIDINENSVQIVDEVQQTATEQFTLENTGSTTVSVSFSNYTLTASDGSGATLVINNIPTETGLTPGESRVVSFSVNTGTLLKTYNGQLIATVVGNATATDSLSVQVVVGQHDISIDGNQVEVDVTYEDLTEDDDNVSVNKAFTVRNTGAFTENVVLSLTGQITGAKLSLSDTSFTLASGATKAVTLTGTLPVDIDSGISEVAKVQMVFDSGTQAKNSSVNADVKSMLEITDLDVTYGEEDETNVGDGETVDDVSPEDHVVLEFKVDNLFDSDYSNGDVDDVDLTVTLDEDEDDEFGDDVDEEESFSVDAGEEEENIQITFDVPDDVEEGTYTFTVNVEGTDDNGAKHEDEMTFKFKIDLERDDVRIREVTFGQDTLTCDRSTTMDIEVKNYGSDDQDDVSLQVYNAGLGIDEKVEMELDESGEDDDEARQSFNINVDEDQDAGAYQVDVRVYIEGDDLQDRETPVLRVAACAEKEEETVSGPERVLVSGADGEEEAEAEVVETTEVPFKQTPAFLAVLVLANVVVLGGVVFLIVKFLR